MAIVQETTVDTYHQLLLSRSRILVNVSEVQSGPINPNRVVAPY